VNQINSRTAKATMKLICIILMFPLILLGVMGRFFYLNLIYVLNANIPDEPFFHAKAIESAVYGLFLCPFSIIGIPFNIFFYLLSKVKTKSKCCVFYALHLYLLGLLFFPIILLSMIGN